MVNLLFNNLRYERLNMKLVFVWVTPSKPVTEDRNSLKQTLLTATATGCMTYR